MIFGQDRRELRKMYADAWQKHCEGLPTSPLEAQIAAVIRWHPEYHDDVTSGDLDRDFTPDGGKTNPFLHMGLHLGLREQISTDRPAGIRQLHQQLVEQTGNAHAAEHRMIDCLAEAMWLSQSQQQPPDEASYLQCLQQLLK